MENLEKDIRALYRSLEVMTAQSHQNKEKVFSIPQISSESIILQYMLSEPESHAFMIRGGEVKTVILPGQKQIELLVKDLHLAIKLRDRGLWQKSASAIQKVIFPEILVKEEIKNIIIIADGALQTVPFAALKVNNKLLIDRFETSYAPSLKAFNELNTDESDRNLAVTVFADPVYQMRDERLNSKNLLTHDSSSALVTQMRNGHDLQRLYGAQYEAAMIKSFATNKVSLKTGFVATRQNVLTDAGEASILHLPHTVCQMSQCQAFLQ